MHSIAPIPRNQQMTRSPGGGEYLILWLCVAILAGVGSFAAWQFWHTDRIFSGVRVAGVPVGGETRAAALLRLRKELTPYPLAPIFLEHDGRRWALGTRSLAPQPDLEDAVNRAYLIGRRGGLVERVRIQWRALGGRLTVSPQITINEGIVRQVVGNAAAEVRRPSRSAVEIGGLSLPPQEGLDVDIAATAQLIMAQAASGGSGTVPLQTVSTAPPQSSPSETEAAQAALSPALPQPVILRHEGSGVAFALDAWHLQRIVPGGDLRFLNEEALRTVVAGWAKQINFPAQDARLRFDDASGGLTVLQPSRAGQRLDISLTIQTVQNALAADQREVALPILSVPAAVDSNRLEELGIKELIASGTTYFGGSSRTRIYNIEVATDKFVGVVIPPGKVFSFNSTVEAVSGANGFEDSAIIWGDRTAVGVGGGVCQVSTTVFRAAMFAGFPILERFNHGYVVSWYGDPGMDATIYTPRVDLKFLNDTGAHLLIQPVVDSVAGILSFRFYGTKPEREVSISEPEYKEVKQPGDPVYQEDITLEPGQIRQVEWAKEGLTATVIRTVKTNGKDRKDTIVSVYRPWNAMFLYGPGTVIPGVTDVREASPAGAEEESAEEGSDG